MSWIEYAKRVAKEYYDEKTYKHTSRVAHYVSENKFIPSGLMEDCIALAWMHDLVEDTNFELNQSCERRIADCLRLISKPKGESYLNYIKKIKDKSIEFPEVYWVKLADMKDHLAQTETLTEKLRDKYLAALPYLL